MDQQPLDPGERDRRRASARARVRRRRIEAAGLLALAAVVVVAVIALAGGGSDDPEPSAGTTASTPAKTKPAQAAPAGRAAEPAPGDSAAPGEAIPILMYHVVEAAPAGTAYPDLWLPGEQFQAQVTMLKRAGYNAITMRDATDYWAGRRRIPKKPIVFTFDDGYLSQLTNAAPALKKARWPGVLYLQAGALKTPGAEGISKDNVKKLIAAGWELGSHTIDHADVSTLAPERLRYEIAYSKVFFQRMFKVKISSFCYPAGKYNDAAVAEVGRAGYSSATTVDEGLGEKSEPLRLKRIRVNGSDTADSLQRKLADAGA